MQYHIVICCYFFFFLIKNNFFQGFENVLDEENYNVTNGTTQINSIDTTTLTPPSTRSRSSSLNSQQIIYLGALTLPNKDYSTLHLNSSPLNNNIQNVLDSQSSSSSQINMYVHISPDRGTVVNSDSINKVCITSAYKASSTQTATTASNQHNVQAGAITSTTIVGNAPIEQTVTKNVKKRTIPSTKGRKKTKRARLDETQVPKFDYQPLEYISRRQAITTNNNNAIKPTTAPHVHQSHPREFLIEEYESSQEEGQQTTNANGMISQETRDLLDTQDSVLLSSQLESILDAQRVPLAAIDTQSASQKLSGSDEEIPATPDEGQITVNSSTNTIGDMDLILNESSHDVPKSTTYGYPSTSNGHTNAAIVPVIMVKNPKNNHNVNTHVECLNLIGICEVEIQLMGIHGAGYNFGGDYN